MDDVYSQQSSIRYLRRSLVYGSKALGLPQFAGDRRSSETAHGSAAGDGSGDYSASRSVGGTGRAVAWFDLASEEPRAISALKGRVTIRGEPAANAMALLAERDLMVVGFL